MKKYIRIFSLILSFIAISGQAWSARTYTAISDLSSLATGDSVIIAIRDGVDLTKWWAMNVNTSNNLQGTYSKPTVSDNSITDPNKAITWKVTKNAGTPTTYTFTNTVDANTYYIAAQTASSGTYTTLTSMGSNQDYNWYITHLSGIYFKFQITNSTGRWMCSGALNAQSEPNKMGSYTTSSTFVYQVTNSVSVCQYACELSIFKKVTAASYTVNYNNGGHGTAPSSTTASSVTLSAITATGWTCTGWKANVNVTNTSTSATITAGTLIANGTNVTLSAATTFTAQWTAKTTTVSFNQNGGDGGQTSSKTATYGSVMPTPITCPTRTHYDFGGYYDGTGGTGTQYYTNTGASARSWDKEAATATLYAKWTEHGLTNYRTLCATCTAPTTVTASPVTGTTATINWSGGASDDGYTVVWSTSSDFPASLDVDNSYTVLSNVSSYEITGLDEGETYYVWVVAECDDSQSDRINFTTPIEHTITFNYPTGFTFGGTSPLTVEDGETFTFPTISKPGSGFDCVTSFKGWVAGENYTGQTTFISAGTTSAAVTADATYTAVWVQEDGASEAEANDYEMVTDEADLESGAKYLMVGYKSGTGYYALGRKPSGKSNRAGVAVTVSDGLITAASVSVATAADQDNKVYELTLGGSEGAWTLQDVSTQYLYASSGSSNNLVSRAADSDDKSKWEISIAQDGHATIDTKYYNDDADGADGWHGSIFFNAGSTLFSCYERASEMQRVYLFKKGGTVSHILTAAPNCDIRLSGDICITSYNGRGIMAAEPLKVLASGLTASTGTVTLTSNSSDVYFSADRIPNFVKGSKPTTSLVLTANGSGNIDTDVYVHYKPSSEGTGAASEVVVTATPTGGLTAIAQHLIHVRNMAEKFVIAAKLGTTWYALPADFSSSAVQPEAIVIDVDENTMTATASKTAPKNCTYTLWPVKTTATVNDRYEGNGECIRPVTAEGHKGLWATGAASGAGIKNAVTIESLGAGTATESENEQYEWRIYTTITDGKWSYNLQSNQAQQIDKSRYLYLYKGENVRWGTYNNGVSNELYFLPVTETEPFDMKVVEWYPTKILIQTNNSVSSPSVTIGGVSIDGVSCASKGSKLYEITIPGLSNTANATKTMKVSYEADDKTYAACVKVPIIISRTEVDVVNGSSELNAPFSTITPAIYNTADLVVRDGAVLKLNGTRAQNTFFDVTIYPTSKISVPAEKKISVHGLAFFGGIDEIYNGSSYSTNKYGVPELSLKGKCGQKTNPTIDYIMRVDLDQMYSLCLPYDVDLDDISYWDGTAMTPGTDLYVSAYDGDARAKKSGKTWIYETDFETKFGAAKLAQGVGYTISAEMQSGVGDTYSIIRLPMESNFHKDETEATKSVYVTAYSSASASDNEKGWNLVGNPYMVSISGGDADSKLVVGYLKEVSTGYEWYNDTYRYVTIPFDDGTDYYQQKFSVATLKPFKNFFLQIAESGDLSFALASRQNAPARYLQTKEREVEFEVLLNNDSRQDNMGLLIADQYSPAYELNADLEKMIGSMSVYTIYGGYNLAYNALSPTEAEELIPVGYVAPAEGEYTFKLDETSDVSEIEHIYLTDYELSKTTDLLNAAYSFSTAAGKNESRFALNVILKAEDPGTLTGLDDVDMNSEQPFKFIHQDKMYILRGGKIYDATGKQVQINK